ncbi:MAG: hypothetical protein SO101_02355 [Lachnospiraceae bacterium]|nr:hypothetical protein [Lachnospiraceae bacterium]
MRKLKKTMLLLLVFTLLITGCSTAGNNSDLDDKDEQATTQNQKDEDMVDDTEGDRCVDIMFRLMQKYGHQVLEQHEAKGTTDLGANKEIPEKICEKAA